MIVAIETKFKDNRKQKLFLNIQKLITNKTVDELEILASIHYLKQIKKNESEIKKMVENKQKRFTAEKVNEMWDELMKWNLL